MYDRTLQNTGSGLAFQRKKKGFTQTQVALLAGISRQDVSRIENGVGGVTWRKVLPYLDVLGIHLPKIIVADDSQPMHKQSHTGGHDD